MQCVDAETLAAWADGGLPKVEAAAVELHLSECDRCTAMLATFVRTTPEVPATESLWQRWHLRWLVPVATAATVAALWVLIPRPGPVPAAISDTDIATQSQVQAPAPAPASPAPASSQADDTKALKSTPARTLSDRSEAVAEPESSSPPPFERARDEAREAPQSTLQRQVAAAPPAPPAAPEADRADRRTTDSRAKSEPPAAPAAAPAPGRAAGLSAAAEESPVRTLRQANTQGFAAVIAQFEVVSPDPMTRWRVIGAGRVERSTDQGAQWQPATLPESATLTGGSSPASSVCWLVGRAGAIYLTTDGLRFIRVPFRERTDFISIQATDGRRATVVTTDGRTMRTDDQGATWIRIAP